MRFPAIPVNHPIGVFYLTAISASVLLKVCYSSPHKRLHAEDDGSVQDVGHQRRLDLKRVSAIARYLETQDATLPGTIILAANSTMSGLLTDTSDSAADLRWKIERRNDYVVDLIVPTTEKMAAVVDGQHRLMGFEDLSRDKQEMKLPCAVFLDLPTAQQASIFATINFNQKPVNKSQTYELFGYNLEDEPEFSWSPDKLAVNFTRRLNIDDESSLKGHIKVAAIDDRVLDDVSREAKQEWLVSTATIVEGILSLITTDQKRDRDILNRVPVGERRRTLLSDQVVCIRQSPPFRKLYIDSNRDIVIYKTLLNYFSAVNEELWSDRGNAVLHKTAGIQALFRVLKELLPEQIKQKALSKETWKSILGRAKIIKFSDARYTESSGRGRSRIQDAILVAIGVKRVEDVRDPDFRQYLSETIGNTYA